MKARRDMARLVFWRKLVKMNISRIAKKIYIVSRSTITPWIQYTKTLLYELGMAKEWLTEDVCDTPDQWRMKIKLAIYQREEILWTHNMSKKPKLRTYIQLKHTLTYESYLSIGNRKGRHYVARLRSGTNSLII